MTRRGTCCLGARWIAVAVVAWGAARGPATAQTATQPGPPFDLRYVARLASQRGGQPIQDVALINPLNQKENAIGWVGTPTNRDAVLNYAVELRRIDNGGQYLAVFHLRAIRYEGVDEPPRAIATVSGPDGRELVQQELQTTGNVQLAAVPVSAPMPGEYRLRLRCGGARYFMGAAASCAYLLPAESLPETPSEELARMGLSAKTLYQIAEGVTGEVTPASLRELVDPLKQAQNALTWSYRGFDRHRFGVHWRFTADANIADKKLRMGLQIRVPVGTPQLVLRGPNKAEIGRWEIYASPELRTLWFDVRFPSVAEYTLELLDEGVGRADVCLYNALMFDG